MTIGTSSDFRSRLKHRSLKLEAGAGANWSTSLGMYWDGRLVEEKVLAEANSQHLKGSREVEHKGCGITRLRLSMLEERQ